MNRVTEFIIRHRWLASLVAFVGLFMPMLAWLSQFIVALVTLRRGPRQGFWIVLWSSMAVPTIWTVLPNVAYAVLFVNVMLGTLLVWALASLLRATESWSMVLTCLVLAGLMGVGFIHINDPNLAQHRQAVLNVNLNHFKALAHVTEITPELQRALDLVLEMASGLLGIMILSSVLMCLLAARWLQARTFNPGALKPELMATHLSMTDMTVLLVVGCLAYFRFAVAIDMVPILILPFVFAGTIAVHRFLDGRKYSKQVLVVYYILLGVAIVQMVMLTTVFAVVDFIRQIRGNNDGSHLIRKNS